MTLQTSQKLLQKRNSFIRPEQQRPGSSPASALLHFKATMQSLRGLNLYLDAKLLGSKDYDLLTVLLFQKNWNCRCLHRA